MHDHAALSATCPALQIFQVTPESLTKDRRGNMPPPSGGIGSY